MDGRYPLFFKVVEMVVSHKNVLLSPQGLFNTRSTPFTLRSCTYPASSQLSSSLDMMRSSQFIFPRCESTCDV